MKKLSLYKHCSFSSRCVRVYQTREFELSLRASVCESVCLQSANRPRPPAVGLYRRSTAMLAPNSLVFEDKELTMFSFTQLEQLSLKVLRSRAWAIRDQVGADRLPPVPQNNEAIVMWILDTQTAISRVVGQEYTIYDFGYPKHGLPTVDDSFFAPQPAMGELSPCVPTSAPSQARSSPLSAGKERAPIHDERAPVPGAHTAADQAMVGAFNEATAARKAAKERARGSGIF